MKPAIVVIAFNRPRSISRLLSSIEKANYETNDIPLCICIDYQDSTENTEVVRIANEFEWKYGEKIIIYQSENLGLKEHVLACGDLTERFESILMLEDDLYVSPYFYDYALQALSFYDTKDSIAGISLYNYQLTEGHSIPFLPVEDGTDIYFLQIASSWGQAWTRRQWSEFKKWFQNNPHLPASTNLPKAIINWPSTSWKKHFIHFLVETDRYFVYPRVSYTANFSDTGTHLNMTSAFQVPIQLGKKIMRFADIHESSAIYDAYFEIFPSVLSKLQPALKQYDYEVDINGVKDVSKVQAEYLLTNCKRGKSVLSFDNRMKPILLNVIFNVPGNSFGLIEKKTVQEQLPIYSDKDTFEILYGKIPILPLTKHFIHRIYSFLKVKIYGRK